MTLRKALAALTTLGLASALLVLCAAPASAATPMILVSPSSGLHDGQTVTVSVSGFSPNVSGVNGVNIVECPASGASQSACNINGAKLLQSTDANGAFTVQLTLKSSLGSIDCTKAACVVVAHEGTDPNSGNTAQQSISFAGASAPTSSAPTTSATSAGNGTGTTTPAPGGGAPTGADTGKALLPPRPTFPMWAALGGLLLLGSGIGLHLRRRYSDSR